MAGTKVVSAFGLLDLALALPVAGPNGTPTWVDFPAVTEAVFKMSVSEVEQKGDNTTLGTFYFDPKGAITVKGSKISMAVFEMLSGNPVSTVSSVESIEFGTPDELIPPRLLARAQVPYRNEDGTSGYYYAYWYAVDCKVVWENIPGAAQGKLGEVQFTLNSYASLVDERGNAVTADYAFGRLSI